MFNLRSLIQSFPQRGISLYFAFIAAFLLTITMSSPSFAHWQDLSVGELEISSKNVVFNLTVPTELMKFADDDRDGKLSAMEMSSHQAELTTLINDRIQFFNQSAQRGTLAIAASPQPLALPTDNVKTHSSLQLSYTWTVPLEELTLNYHFFPAELTTARCLVTLFYAPVSQEGNSLGTTAPTAAPQSLILTPNQREFSLISRPLWQQVSSFIELGIEHILTGYDHILFLISLLLASHQLRYLLKIVTAFTISHSIALSLTALNIIALPAPWVESAIALSIVYVACENLWRQNVRWRWLVALGFGLIHGMGFASILQDIHIPRSQLFTALVSFNLGVEVGQLIIVIFCYLGLQGLRRWINRETWHQKFVQWSSSGIIAIGLFWFCQRTVLAIVPLKL
ncbi:MAG: hypothetical protein B0A82_07720 [Alkalinema sp. CACIAM 70d]|nr:MAG: hypothetical protein B0A82_07720 [Alkalinema sp. CACIAM 70d]